MAVGGWWRQYAPLKRRSTIILHGSITQTTALNIVLRLLTIALSLALSIFFPSYCDVSYALSYFAYSIRLRLDSTGSYRPPRR
jgi:uncharacterized membrane protein YwzB